MDVKGQERVMGVTSNGFGLSFWADGNVLELVVGVTQLYKHPRGLMHGILALGWGCGPSHAV